jgi:hypothetical protein
VDNYVLYVLNDLNMNQAMNSSLQLNQTQLIPLIGKFSLLITCSNSFLFYLLEILPVLILRKKQDRERENK